MTYHFKPAQRSDTKPLIGLYGQSGCGKTYSALLLARGMAGEKGRVGMIDTESGRGSLYADVLPGGYEVMELSAPFTPDSYIEAIEAAEKSGIDVLIIDSASHEWEGIGGVLDMAADIEKRTGKPGLHCWKDPKLKHQKFMLKLLQAKVPVILCLRAKYKSRQVRNERTGKQEIIKDDYTTPQQAEDFIFEMTAHAEVLQDHSINLTKCSHPELRKCFPTKGPITIEHGRMIAAWAQGGRQQTPPQPAQAPAVDLFGQPIPEYTLPEIPELASDADESAIKRWLADLRDIIDDAPTVDHVNTLRMMANDGLMIVHSQSKSAFDYGCRLFTQKLEQLQSSEAA